MTDPTGPQGYPDWVHVAQVALSPVLKGAGIDMTKVNSFGPFYVGNAACLVVYGIISDSTAPAQCVFDFGDDAALTLDQGLPVLILPPASLNVRVTDVIPVLGNFVLISMPDALGVGVCELQVVPMCVPVRAGATGINPMLSANAFTVATSGTETKVSDVVCGTRATAAMSTDTADWALMVEAMAADGNWYTIGYEDSVSGALGCSFGLDLPRSITRLSYINRSGSTATVSMSLTARMS